MVKRLHKAFELIGKRILIVDSAHRNKEGIFQDSTRFQTTTEGITRLALDFIEPIYNPNPGIEEIAKGQVPKERIDPRNPILNFHFGVDHLRLCYILKRGRTHLFGGELVYVGGGFINDGNEVYDRYRESLRNAGFDVR